MLSHRNARLTNELAFTQERNSPPMSAEVMLWPEMGWCERHGVFQALFG